MASLELRKVIKRYAETAVIHGVDLSVADGEFVVFVGPSGCGKSTLLRMISGLETVSEGEVEIDGRRVNDVSAAQRGLAMVFQSYALYPHMTVYQNMAFGLENIRTPRAEIDARVQAAAKLLQLDRLLDRRPTQLSGGQRQRVAIGRAIVREPAIFLFDEPLSNLDAELRVQMRTELTALHRRLKTTMIYVTHDQVEAMTMADKIVVLRGGRVEQVGAPLELYNAPRNRFVAGFIGSPRMNFLPAKLTSVMQDAVDVTVGAGGMATLPFRGGAELIGGDVTLGIRPEHVALEHAEPGALRLPATVELTERLGATSFLYCALADGTKLTVQAAGEAKGGAGERIEVAIPVGRTHLFNATETGVALERVPPPVGI
ncbi:MAG TPA: sn-glycerol-3-phosphate ABC transporter ATP-binding protein UgpC [Casimicrobiaceae bacterium]|nr:sn-glycerol-3-phosphate ABC transporter ATP-binding protein UgpC [Casimicrobiaceae bacterium]